MTSTVRRVSLATACTLALFGMMNLNSAGTVVVRNSGATTLDEKMGTDPILDPIKGTDPILDELKMTNPILEKLGNDPILEKMGGDPILSADFTF